jgi:hypothetical protein
MFTVTLSTISRHHSSYFVKPVTQQREASIHNAKKISLESANLRLAIAILLAFWVPLVVALQASQNC